MTQQYPPTPPPPSHGAPDPQQWQGYGQQAPPPAPKKRKWPWIIGGLFVLVFVVPALGNSGSNTTPKSSTSSSAAPVAPAAAAPAPQAEQEAPVAAPAGPTASFGDGTWVVGEDIVAGTYKSPGAQEGIMEFCAVTTHAGDTSDSPVLDIASANANEPIRIKVSGKVKSVEAHGCEDFTKVG